MLEGHILVLQTYSVLCEKVSSLPSVLTHALKLLIVAGVLLNCVPSQAVEKIKIKKGNI